MPIDVIGFAVARAEAENQGLRDQDANRIGVIGSVMSSPVMALIVGRAIASREVAERPVVRTEPPAGGDTPTPQEPGGTSTPQEPAGGGQQQQQPPADQGGTRGKPVKP